MRQTLVFCAWLAGSRFRVVRADLIVVDDIGILPATHPSDIGEPGRHAVIRRGHPSQAIAYIRLSLVAICYAVEPLWLRKDSCSHLRPLPPRALCDGFPGGISPRCVCLDGVHICSCH